MKKNILIIAVGLSCIVLVGCGSKVKTGDSIDTGMLFSGEQVLTGTQSGEILLDQNGNIREELSGDTTKGALVITGRTGGATAPTGVTGTTSKTVSSDVAKLIQQRANQPVDNNKLTEDDIDLIDKVIQKVGNMK